MGPVSSSPLRVTVIDNRPRLAIIHPRRSINHFQRKQHGERSFKWGRFFYHDNCNYVQQISPRVPWCLHSLKWKRLPFPWLTAGILQIFFVFLFSLPRLRTGTADDSPLQHGSRILFGSEVCDLQTLLGVCCGLYRVPDLLRCKSERQDWCHFGCQSQKIPLKFIFSWAF